MNKFAGQGIAAAAAVALLSAGNPALAKNNTGAIVGGIIAGAAVGAVVSSTINQPRTVYVPVAPQPQRWEQIYSPKPGINCYPAQRACYNSRGAYSAKWTWNVYAR